MHQNGLNVTVHPQVSHAGRLIGLSMNSTDIDMYACCVTQRQSSVGQAESYQPVPSTAGGGLLDAEERHVPTAEQSLTPSGAQLSHVRTTKFYGKNRQLLIDQRVAHLRANVQQRLRINAAAAPFEHFSLQRHAFAWAAEHELAADLR